MHVCVCVGGGAHVHVHVCTVSLCTRTVGGVKGGASLSTNVNTVACKQGWMRKLPMEADER